MRLFKHLAILMALLIIPASVLAQADRLHVRKGNRLFRKGDFNGASLEYQKALSANDANTQAIYNLGVAALQLGNDSLAVEQFKMAGKMETSKLRRAMAYHNIGVVMQSHQKYGEAIEAYKEALRCNPSDDETRYNLVLCKRQQQQNQQDQNNQNNQGGGQNDKNKDKKDKDKDKNQQNKDKQQDQKDQQDQQKQPNEQTMSKENAQRLLDAAVQEEKRTQDKLQKAMQQSNRKLLEKNW